MFLYLNMNTSTWHIFIFGMSVLNIPVAFSVWNFEERSLKVDQVGEGHPKD